jgi:hypothetical protein
VEGEAKEAGMSPESVITRRYGDYAALDVPSGNGCTKGIKTTV